MSAASYILFAGNDNTAARQTPPPPRCAWSPSPAIAGPDASRRSRGAVCARVLPTVSSCPPCQTALPETKGGGAPTGATVLWPHHPDAAACSAEHARLSALHRGSRLGARAPPLSFGPRFTLWRIVTSAHSNFYAGLRTLSAAKLSQTPGRPVVMPAGTMPEAAREQFAKPPAGAAPAPHSGLPSGKRPLRERGNLRCNRNGDNCQ